MGECGWHEFEHQHRCAGVVQRGPERSVAERYATPLRVPVVAVYSKRDGVVAWQACIDRWSPDMRHVEVNETHIGLVFATRVLSIIVDEIERD